MTFPGVLFSILSLSFPCLLGLFDLSKFWEFRGSLTFSCDCKLDSWVVRYARILEVLWESEREGEGKDDAECQRSSHTPRSSFFLPVPHVHSPIRHVRKSYPNIKGSRCNLLDLQGQDLKIYHGLESTTFLTGRLGFLGPRDDGFFFLAV